MRIIIVILALFALASLVETFKISRPAHRGPRVTAKNLTWARYPQGYLRPNCNGNKAGGYEDWLGPAPRCCNIGYQNRLPRGVKPRVKTCLPAKLVKKTCQSPPGSKPNYDMGYMRCC